MKIRKRWPATLIVVLLLALGLRLALPWILEDYVNDQLASLEGYSGSVQDVDVALWRGAYQVQDVVIRKRGLERTEPFFTGSTIDLSIEWNELLNGALVGRLLFREPELNLVEAEQEERSQTGEEVQWDQRFDQLFPFRFNTITVQNGTLRFRTPGIQTNDALEASGINGRVENLTNVRNVSDEAFAQFRFAGRVLGAPLRLAGRVDPGAEQPTFDVNATLEKVKLADLNPWLREYLNADAEGGTFALYTELAARDGRFEGYAKPFAEDVNILELDEESAGLLQKAWEAALEFAAEIFENQPEEEVASRIPIGGSFDEPRAGVVTAILNVLRNAFVGAFTRSLEGSISLPDEAGKEQKEEQEEEKSGEEENNGREE